LLGQDSQVFTLIVIADVIIIMVRIGKTNTNFIGNAIAMLGQDTQVITDFIITVIEL
jgi:hypothetical protein